MIFYLCLFIIKGKFSIFVKVEWTLHNNIIKPLFGKRRPPPRVGVYLFINIMIGIYKITSPTKKVYIGQSINIEKRFLSYKALHCKNQTIIYNSLKKYGADKHKFEILCECEIIELNDKERYYQDLYSAIGISGMNCKLTKSNDRSGKLSNEIKEKIRISHIGMIKKPESVEKSRIALKKRYEQGYISPRKGIKVTDDVRKKISDSKTGLKLSAEHKEKIRLSLLGSKRLLGRTLSISHKENCKLNATKHLSKIILDTQTGVFYESAKELSYILKIPHSTLRCRLNGTVVNKTSFIYV